MKYNICNICGQFLGINQHKCIMLERCNTCGRFLNKLKLHKCEEHPWNKGLRKEIDERVRKISEKLRYRVFSEEQKKKISESNIGKPKFRTLEHNQKIGLALKGKPKSENARKKMSEKAKLRIGSANPFYGKHHTFETKEKLRNSCKIASEKKWKDIEYRKKVLEKHPSLKWKNKDFREKTIKSILKGLFKRPTSLENQMIKIVKKYNLPYKYVGNGSFLIGYKNPDFINTNGEKICIEVGNEYHHNKNYSQERMEHFAKFGWKCFVFITNELNEDEIIRTVKG